VPRRVAASVLGLSPGSLGVAMRTPAKGAMAPSVPAGRRAVRCLTHDRNASGGHRSSANRGGAPRRPVHIPRGWLGWGDRRGAPHDTEVEAARLVVATLLTSSSLSSPLPAPDGDSQLISHLGPFSST
jgi:hypothetical protein